MTLTGSAAVIEAARRDGRHHGATSTTNLLRAMDATAHRDNDVTRGDNELMTTKLNSKGKTFCRKTG